MAGVIALVPMKAQSERVPNKNMRDFCGRPLFHRIVETLQQSRSVQQICVDTDSEAIMQDIKAHFPAVTTIPRPRHLCGNLVPMNKIIAYDLSIVEGDHFLQTHATNPLLQTATIDRAIETFFGLKEHDSLFSATRWQTRFFFPDGTPVNHNPAELLRTQDLPPLYEENSNIYLFSRESFAKRGSRIGERPFLFEMNRLEALDIDEEADFVLAELLFRHRGLLADQGKKGGGPSAGNG